MKEQQCKMIIHEIHDLTNQHVTRLLQSGLSFITNEEIIKNYHPDYSNENSNLFYILKKGRYILGNGKYFVIEDDGKFIASSGWNKYDYDSDTALLLTRTFVNPGDRYHFILGKNLLPKMINESKNYKRQWITVNEFNKKMYNWVEAMNNKNYNLPPWKEVYKSFQPIGIKDIYFTKQYVLEHRKFHE